MQTNAAEGLKLEKLQNKLSFTEQPLDVKNSNEESQASNKDLHNQMTHIWEKLSHMQKCYE